MGVVGGATVGGCVLRYGKERQRKKKGLLTNDKGSTVPYSVLIYGIIPKWVAVNDGHQIRRGDLLEKRTAHELAI
jgi:hypothetical protein